MTDNEELFRMALLTTALYSFFFFFFFQPTLPECAPSYVTHIISAETDPQVKKSCD